MKKIVIISVLIISVFIIISWRFLFVVVFWGNLPEAVMQNFLPRKTILKVEGVRISEISKINSISNSFYFSNKKDKIAYIDKDYNLAIFDIPSKWKSIIYHYRKDDFNKTLSNNSYGKPRLLWSPNDNKILFADSTELFIYDFTNDAISLCGNFYISDPHSEEMFKAGWTNPIYDSIDYKWIDSSSVMWNGDFKNYTVKNLENGSSNTINGVNLASYKWQPDINAFIGEPGGKSGRSSYTYIHMARNDYKDLEVVINNNLETDYRVSSYTREATPVAVSRDVWRIEVKDPIICLEQLDKIAKEPALSIWQDRIDAQKVIGSLLRSLLINVVYLDGKTEYKKIEYKKFDLESKSPDGLISVSLVPDNSGRLLIQDSVRNETSEFSLNGLRFARNLGFLPFYWLDNDFILFAYNKDVNNSRKQGICLLDIKYRKVTEYGNKFYPTFYPSPNNDKVMVSYGSDEFYMGDGSGFRYQNLSLFDKYGREKLLYKISVKGGMIASVSWRNDSNTFYFLTQNSNNPLFSLSRFEEKNRFDYSLYAMELY